MRDLTSDNGGRRKNEDRRQFVYTVHIPERRSGIDRRVGGDRRNSQRHTQDFCQNNFSFRASRLQAAFLRSAEPPKASK